MDRSKEKQEIQIINKVLQSIGVEIFIYSGIASNEYGYTKFVRTRPIIGKYECKDIFSGLKSIIIPEDNVQAKIKISKDLELVDIHIKGIAVIHLHYTEEKFDPWQYYRVSENVYINNYRNELVDVLMLTQEGKSLDKLKTPVTDCLYLTNDFEGAAQSVAGKLFVNNGLSTHLFDDYIFNDNSRSLAIKFYHFIAYHEEGLRKYQ